MLNNMLEMLIKSSEDSRKTSNLMVGIESRISWVEELVLDMRDDIENLRDEKESDSDEFPSPIHSPVDNELNIVLEELKYNRSLSYADEAS
jgi:hypothetical protein